MDLLHEKEELHPNENKKKILDKDGLPSSESHLTGEFIIVWCKW